MNFVTLIGYFAGALTTCSFVPQVVRTIRRKRCEDVSAAMLVALASGVLLWLIYGIYLRSVPIILANAVTLVLLVALLVMKSLFRGQDHGTPASRRLTTAPDH